MRVQAARVLGEDRGRERIAGVAAAPFRNCIESDYWRVSRAFSQRAKTSRLVVPGS